MQRYIGIIHKSEDGGFGICFPDFLGCIAVADNTDCLIKQGRQALQSHINLMSEYGETLPKNAMTLEHVMNSDLAKNAYLITDICARLPIVFAPSLNIYKRRINDNGKIFKPSHARSKLFTANRLHQSRMATNKKA